ncbi:MAG: hypothetical protein WA839_12780, partial [Flavobacteriaceae bacterium]
NLGISFALISVFSKGKDVIVSTYHECLKYRSTLQSFGAIKRPSLRTIYGLCELIPIQFHLSFFLLVPVIHLLRNQ